MDQLFITLTAALSGGGLVPALPAVDLGVLSNLLSPCHRVSLPPVVALTSRQEEFTWKTALVFSVLIVSP